MFENVDGRTDDGRTDGRTTDARVTGILIAHLGAFGSGELKRVNPSLVGQWVTILQVSHIFHSLISAFGPAHANLVFIAYTVIL